MRAQAMTAWNYISEWFENDQVKIALGH